MLDADRVSHGWQVWLTPRQTRILRDALVVYQSTLAEPDEEAFNKLFEWFDGELRIQQGG